MRYKPLILLITLLSPGFSFSQGIYFEYKLSNVDFGEMGNVKTYYLEGNTRSEAKIDMGQINKTIVTLLKSSDPGKVYQLDLQKKTYMVNESNQKNGTQDYNEADYEITVLGKETVNGFNSTHVKVKNLKNSTSQELWTSTEVPAFEELSKVKSKYTGEEGLNKALKAKGAWGFPVRVEVAEHGSRALIDLVKAEKRNIDPSMFSLDGYTKSEPAKASMPASGQQEMIQKIQNMTPEQRQQYMEQLKQQYQNQPH